MVQGSYSLLESDGTRRIVDYTADDHNGFNAVVRKEAAITKIAAPIIAAAPAKIAYAPQAHYSYAQPIVAAPAHVSYAQPIAKLSPATAHITYAQPVAKYEPALTYGPPVAKIPATPSTVLTAGKYTSPLSYIAHVTYTSPYISYAH